MVNPLMLDILKRKVDDGEVSVDDIKNAEYKAAIQEYLNSK